MYGRARSYARRSGAVAVASTQVGGAYALQFPTNVSGSDTTAPYVAIKFANPHLNGLPIWGAGGAGVTVVRKIRPTQQTGYYAQFWWSNDGSFLWNGGSSGSYWGMHPYPQSSSNAGTTHWWEIATSVGGDFTDTRSGVGLKKTVVQDTTYLQGMRVTRTDANNKTLVFYTSLPSVANADVIEYIETSASYGETNPPSPAVTIGDSPWYASFQHERFGGVLDAIKIFNAVLTEADMLSEADDFSALKTAAGSSAIWWGKNGFANIDDLTCSYGTGRSFVWADPANKATLVARL